MMNCLPVLIKYYGSCSDLLGRNCNLISVLVLTSYTNDSTLLGSTLLYSPNLFLFGIIYTHACTHNYFHEVDNYKNGYNYTKA